jgi:Undecaprenyl-phosphate glucose phosphotransferase
MIQRLNRYQFYFRLLVCILPALAFTFAAASRLVLPVVTVHYGWYYFVLEILTSAVWAVLAAYHHLSSIEPLISEETGLRRPFAATLSLSGILALILYFVRDVHISRVFLALSCLFLFVLAWTLRVAFREYLRRVVGRDAPLRILVVGSDMHARRTVRKLRKMPVAACAVVGYLRVPGQEIAVRDAHIYELETINEIDPADLDDIIVAVSFEQLGAASTIVDQLQHLCRPIRAVIDIGEMFTIKTTPLRFGRLQVLDLGKMPIESVQYQFTKRAFDIVFSVFAIAFTGPLMAAIALAIKLTSPGPVFFRQERVGYNGERFPMLKFRSMVVNTVSDTAHTSSKDPRITVVGRLIRKTSLDELPQFFNVLMGHMSVVGPRPELTFFVHKFKNEIPAYMSRHTIKCGITGWAQVHGLRGSDSSIATRVQYDIDYIRNWSLLLDLKIIALTVFSGFSSRNAF